MPLLVQPNCASCPFSHCRKVPPSGNPDAEIALVGEGAGDREERQGRPFVGPSGLLLNWFLKRAGLHRPNLWITNAELCRPRAVRKPDLSVEPFPDGTPAKYVSLTKDQALEKALVACRSRLHKELAMVQPKVILAVGKHALTSLLGPNRGILNHHGAVHEMALLSGHRAHVIPILHPAFLLREAQNHSHAIVRILEKAKRIARAGLSKAHAPQYLLVSPYHPRGAEYAVEQLEAIVREVVAARDDVAIDVETTWGRTRDVTLTVVGFGVARLNLGVAVSVLTWNRADRTFQDTWPAPLRARVFAALGALLASRCQKWFWHEAFDIPVLERYFPLQGPFEDGLHCHWVMQPDLPHRLSYAAQTYLDIPPWKCDFWANEKKGTATNHDLLFYNARDCIYTAYTAIEVQHEVVARRLEHLIPWQGEVAALARRVQARGVPVDAQTWGELHLTMRSERYFALKEMKDAISATPGALENLNKFVHRERCTAARKNAKKRGGIYREPVKWNLSVDDFNPRSDYQGPWFLYEFLKLTPQKWTAGGSGDVKDKKRSKSYKGVLRYLKNPLVAAYVRWWELAARLQTLDEIQKKVTKVDDGHYRLFFEWNVCGQRGTRWSSSPNAQNLTKLMRRIFKASPGRVWVGADAAQVEYRLAAVLAGLTELLEIFAKPPYDEDLEPWKKFDPEWDAHSLVAVEVYGDDYVEEAKTFEEGLRELMCTYGRTAPEVLKWKDPPKDASAALRRVQAAGKALSTWRTLVKRVTFALFYGAHPPKILESLRENRDLPSGVRAQLTLQRIEEIWHGFNKRFPQWDAWFRAELRQIRKHGYQEFPPLRRRRYWTQRDLDPTRVKNTPIQLAAGDACNRIFKRIQDRIDAEGLDAHMAIHLHDALYLDCAEDCAPRVCEIVNEEFNLWIEGPRGRVLIWGRAGVGPSVADVG